MITEDEFAQAHDIIELAESIADKMMGLRYPKNYRHIHQSSITMWADYIEVEFEFSDGDSCDSIDVSLDDLNDPDGTVQREADKIEAAVQVKVDAAEAACKLRQTFSHEDWTYEVANGDTKLGFDAWVEHKVEAELS